MAPAARRRSRAGLSSRPRPRANRAPDFRALFADDAVVLHGVLAEEMAFLQKPFTLNALARKVRALLDER